MTGYLTRSEFSSFDEIISGNNNFSHATPFKKGLKLPSRFASLFSGKKGKKEKVEDGESLESDAENSPKTSQDDEEENLIYREGDNTSVSSTKSSIENIKENTDTKRNAVIEGSSSILNVFDPNEKRNAVIEGNSSIVRDFNPKKNSDAETDKASGSGENTTKTTSEDEKTMI